MNFAKSLMLSACALALASCGGGGSDTSASAASAGASSGILTDSPVGGVQYTTSGGYSGTTSASGQYNYNPGETVTFKIGAITLGTVTATGTITPLQLAGTGANSGNITTNLLVLLQSLDADNDPSNGITINAATQAAANSAGALDLTQAPAQFASTGNAALTSVLSGAGLPRTAPVDPAAALAHFKEQFFKQLAGTWTGTSEETVSVFRFDAAGKYIMGEAGPAKDGGMSGTEVAQIDWNPSTGAISSVSGSIIRDTNAEWGLSHLAGTDTLRFDGDKLILTDADGTVTPYTRVGNNPDSLVGMWALNSATTLQTQTFVFTSDNKYMMLDPLGDTDHGAGGPCTTLDQVSSGGIEYGTYSFNATAGAFAVTQAPAYDTNSCAGLWDQPASSGSSFTFVFNTDKSAITFDGQTLHRVSK